MLYCFSCFIHVLCFAVLLLNSLLLLYISLFLEGWCLITSVWLAMVLTVVVVTLLSAGCMIFKSKNSEHHYHLHKINLVRPNSPLTMGCFQIGIHYNTIDNANGYHIWLIYLDLFPLGKSQLFTLVPVSASAHQLSNQTGNCEWHYDCANVTLGFETELDLIASSSF